MDSCQVYFIKVTHTGRHAGVVEAYNLSLGLDDIRHLGGWSIGQMEAFYAPRNPDTAIILKLDCQHRTLINRLITARPDIFENEEFLAFKAKPQQKISDHENHANFFPKEVPVNSDNIVGALKGLADKIQQSNTQMDVFRSTLNDDRLSDRQRQQAQLQYRQHGWQLAQYHQESQMLSYQRTTMPLLRPHPPSPQWRDFQQQQQSEWQQLTCLRTFDLSALL
ncbi:hypothetical protein EC957_009480 [Mortierella hygrophila]|uniref:Uncharacterized protein n=1 Tax=Mortierella hygrophila TaxID=979708 RepID=A0A9P6FC32_9FUNG|nr:hypothetical protein EC957_009480 [Mortierella hygrophila]